jgi:hypothetical protein
MKVRRRNLVPKAVSCHSGYLQTLSIVLLSMADLVQVRATTTYLDAVHSGARRWMVGVTKRRRMGAWQSTVLCPIAVG